MRKRKRENKTWESLRDLRNLLWILWVTAKFPMRLLMQNSCTCWGPVTVVLRVHALRERGGYNKYKYKNTFNSFSLFLLYNKMNLCHTILCILIYSTISASVSLGLHGLFTNIVCLCDVWIKLPAYCTAPMKLFVYLADTWRV